MAKNIPGITLNRSGDIAICYIDSISPELKGLIKKNLSAICHGSHITDYFDEPLYSYKTTLCSFMDRYNNKTDETKIGMIGEFLSHILLAELFDEFQIASAFFNLEENSIKKGFDLILYKESESSAWITEVKSGGLHKNKTHDETTRTLLNTAKSDLKKRLNETEVKYWYNSINSVRCSLNDDKDYKKTLLKILRGEGNTAVENKAKGSDNSVVLVAGLFESMEKKISLPPIEVFINKVKNEKLFGNTLVFCIQKETYTKVAELIESEAYGVVN